jgi:3-oxoacyl-[acyl-carrier-protein] synthase III
MTLPPIGILATGTYIPTPRMTSGEIAEATGIPRSMIEEKFGILEKPIPGPNDHPCMMGAKAAKRALRRAKVDPLAVDAIISISEEYKEYPLMVSGIKIQQLIGAKNAWAVDIAQRSCTTIAGLKLAQGLMQSDPSLKTVLLAGGYRNGDLIDFSNPRVSFMYNLAAGGGAILLRRNHNENIVLGSSLITDGDFADDVHIPHGGTMNPLTSEDINSGRMMLEVTDVEGMKNRLGERSHTNFMRVIHESVERSNVEDAHIDYLALLHMKRSAHTTTLGELGLRLDQSFYLERYGHIGQIDSILSLERGVGSKRIKPGGLVVMASAGVGYTWGAQAIRWG